MTTLSIRTDQDDPNDYVNCPECDGQGEVSTDNEAHASFALSYGYIYESFEICEHCNGNGYIRNPNH
jgi:DnaJ-class molecular chaperone